MDKIVSSKKFKRVAALILAVVTILSMFFALPVSAKTGDTATITFDYCYDTGGGIITFAKTVTNGSVTVGTPGEELCRIYADGKEAYCIEPGYSLFSGNGQGAYLAEKVDKVVLGVVRKYLDAIKVTPKSLTMEKQYKTEIADTKKLKKKVEAELETLKKQSVKLSAEIGKVLIGESNYTSDILTTSINVINQAIAEKENEIAEIELKLANQQDDIGKLDFYYD